MAMTDPYNSAASGPPPVPRTSAPLGDAMITTAFELPGYRIVASLGLVRGIVVRSRSVVGNFVGGIQTLFGGNITIYTELCAPARLDTYRDMVKHARERNANAIVGMRCDATAVVVEPAG